MSELIITIPLTGDPDQDSITVDDALWFNHDGIASNVRGGETEGTLHVKGEEVGTWRVTAGG